MRAKQILVFGSPKASCKNCRKLEAMIDEIVMGHESVLKVRKLTLDSEEAQKYGVLLTPSVVVDSEIIVLGEIPEQEVLADELLQ